MVTTKEKNKVNKPKKMRKESKHDTKKPPKHKGREKEKVKGAE